jgi:hypothetical protein
MYVWLLARDDGCFDDIEYSFEIAIPGAGKYEIDFALTYKGRLLIVECKTGNDAFVAKTIDRLTTVSNQLGGNFVGKVIVSNRIMGDSNGIKGFLDQMRKQQVVVVDGSKLKNLIDILKREAGVDGASPTYIRS